MQKNKPSERHLHPIEPLFDQNSTCLILGSFPSVRSRSEAFYYAHPQNRFWKTLAAVFGEPAPTSIEEKTSLILSHHLALWDVIAACRITGSSDSSICDVEPNDLSRILLHSRVTRIYVNGKTAERYYQRYQRERTGLEAICLPSTSPANAAWTQDRLCLAWSRIKTD